MKRLYFVFFFFVATHFAFSQNAIQDELKPKINSSLTNIYRETLLRPGKVAVDSIAVNDKKKASSFTPTFHSLICRCVKTPFA